MTILRGCVVLAGLSSLSPGRSSAQHADTPVAIINVNVIPMDRERVLPDQTVIVRGGSIAEMGPASSTSIPTNATRINAQGKYLIPGLVEMHGHIPGGSASEEVVSRVLQLYAINGITTVRGDAWSSAPPGSPRPGRPE